MQKLITKSSGLNGQLKLPSDKSITHRALILAALTKGKTIVKSPLISEDTLTTMNALKPFGVVFNRLDNTAIEVISPGMDNFLRPDNLIINMGNSGTSTRLLTGVFAGLGIKVTLIGDDSLSKRPMARIITPLTKLGAIIESDANHLPMKIVKGIDKKAIDFLLPLGSAQVKNTMLLAGLSANVETIITDNFNTRNHTEKMLPEFGIKIKNLGNNKFKILSNQHLKPTTINVASDISAAAFWLVGASIVKNSQVELKNVNINKTRAGILDALQKMNANIDIIKKTEKNEPAADFKIKSANLNNIQITEKEVPKMIDELPVIVLAATQATGKTIISGASELAVKETNRITVVTEQLNKLGADITATADGFIVKGPTPLFTKETVEVDGHGDHRIAMMLAIAALITNGKVMLKDPNSVKVSYPNFFYDLDKLVTN